MSDDLIEALDGNTTAVTGLTALLREVIDNPEGTMLLRAIVAATGNLTSGETDKVLDRVGRHLREERDRLSDEEIASRPRGALISFEAARTLARKLGLRLHSPVPQYLWNALGSDELEEQLDVYNRSANQRDKVVLRIIGGTYCSEDLKRLRKLLESSVVKVRNLGNTSNQTWQLFTALADLES